MMSKDKHSEPAKLIAAAKAGDVGGVTAAIRAGANKEAGDPETHNYTALHWSAERGHTDVVMKLLNMRVNVNVIDIRGRTALHQVCFFGHDYVAKLLIGRCAVIDAVDKDCFTPLMVASLEGHENLVVLLLNAGANMELKDKDGWASIHHASGRNRDKVVKILLENKAQVDSKNVHGATALHVASGNGHAATAHMLITHGANVNSAASDGATPFINASQNGRDRLVSLLILYGANIEAVMNDGESSLIQACSNGHLSTVNILIEEGADLNRKSKKYIFPLLEASRKGYVDIVETLLRKGVQKNITDGSTNEIWQAAHAAANEGHLNVLLKLKEYGCDLNVTTKQSNSTPLHLSIQEGHIKVAKWLLVNGANPHARDRKGDTPYQLAFNKGHKELANFTKHPPTKELNKMSLDQVASGASKKINSTLSRDSTPSTSSRTTKLECAVCMDPRTSTVMTLPCRHAVTCQKCMDELEQRGDNKCPLCRAEIGQRHTIFIN